MENIHLKGLVSKETVVPGRCGSEAHKSGNELVTVKLQKREKTSQSRRLER